jgi:EpsI family protein
MRRPSRAAVCGSIAAAVLLIGPLARFNTLRAMPTIEAATLPAIAGCSTPSPWASDWAPTFVDPDYTIAFSYRCDGYLLHVRLVQYVDQHQGKEAVGELNSVIPREWWNSTVRQREFVSDDVPVDEYRVDRQGRRLSIWNWYAVGLHATTSPFAVKAFEAWNALRFRSVPTTNITVAIEGAPQDATNALLNDATSVWAWFTQQGGTA